MVVVIRFRATGGKRAPQISDCDKPKSGTAAVFSKQARPCAEHAFKTTLALSFADRARLMQSHLCLKTKYQLRST
jgi:hypothetical protein